MSGIVNWLRVMSDDHSMARRLEAAEYIEELWDQIERLHNDNARLREALEQIAGGGLFQHAHEFARATLEGQEKKP